MTLDTPLKGLMGIGPSINQRLQALNLQTVKDLITYYPFRYDDFSHQASIAESQIGEIVTLKGQIWSIKNIFTRKGKVLTQALLNDGTNTIELVWFNQSWLPKSIQPGDSLQVSGKVGKSGSRLSLVAPRWEKIANIESSAKSLESRDSTLISDIGNPNLINSTTPDSSILDSSHLLHTGRLVPIYSETYGLTSKWLRTKIAEILPQVKDQIEDKLPAILDREMLPLVEAIEQSHFPTDWQKLQAAQERLAFDELFYIQLTTQKVRREWNQKRLIEPLQVDQADIDQLIANLPFSLTGAQQRVVDEILTDLQKPVPMNRLVQGEVGSGKTIVAAIVAKAVVNQGKKVLLMAPTEILALQHFHNFSRLFTAQNIEVGLFTGSHKYNQIKKIRGQKSDQSKRTYSQNSNSLKSDSLNSISDPQIIIGTHALVGKNFQIDNVGLVIVDEQQRFGVEQRTILRQHASIPHFLTMTATPIPRTVALTMYGDLDLSIIDELPPNRIAVQTHYVPAIKRADSYKFIHQKVIEQGDQVYLVTPLIDQSETMLSAKAAKVEFERLKTKVWPDLRIGLLHGKLKPAEKAEVLNQFKDHQLDILVSTSVVEVGVDVPNATIIVIEGAERFGLAGLHQLRGRVGRGTKESYCLLFSEDSEPNTIKRLKNLETINNGLKLAELDLKIRGSGEVFGTRQSGRFNLKVASLDNLSLIEQTRSAALGILDQSPDLAEYPFLKQEITKLQANVSPD